MKLLCFCGELTKDVGGVLYCGNVECEQFMRIVWPIPDPDEESDDDIGL